MEIIELERWEPSETDPRRLEYAGQRTAQEVFEELKHRLEGMGYLPDEYFLLDSQWKDGQEIPREADIFCTTDYGGNEGVYLDVYLKWYEDSNPITKSFVTGKTLGENGNDLDRMFLISSAVTKAFHGDHAAHARYMKIGGVEEDTGGCVVHLSQREQKILIGALVEQRERQEHAMSQTEQLLRRMTGSITEYVNTVGMRPLRLSGYDKTVLAIRDGELSAFRELYPKVLNHADELLVEAAGRPGAVGRQMTSLLLADAERFSEDAYHTACRRAVDIGDLEKTLFLLEQVGHHVENLSPPFHGTVARYAYRDRSTMAAQIVKHCTPEQIAAAPASLIREALLHHDHNTARALAANGISADGCITPIVQYCAGDNIPWLLTELLELGMKVSPDYYEALHACVEYGCPEAGKQLLDHGMDFDKFRDWALCQPHGLTHNAALVSIESHWDTLRAQKQSGTQTGEMTFG